MADEMNGERVTDAMVHAALKAKNPTLYRDHLRHPANGPVLNASTEKEIQVTRKMLAAALGASLAANAGIEPVAKERFSEPLSRVIYAGALLANCAFNLAQKPGQVLTPSTANTLSECRKEWDAACAAFKAHPSPPEGMVAGWKWVPVEPTEEMKAAAVKYANGTAVYKNVKAEVLHWMLGHYFRHGDEGWRKAASDDMGRMRDEFAARATGAKP